MSNDSAAIETQIQWGQSEASATIVCSDCSRNGKTLFAKLAADLMKLRHGEPPHIFDTDDPDGGLATHFPDHSQVIDIARTRQQVALFDGMLERRPEAGPRHYLIDLCARHFVKFFDIFSEIQFEDGAEAAELDLTVFFLIDRTPDSIEAAAALSRTLSKTRFVTVRSSAIGDALSQGRCADTYQAMRKEREILLPKLSSQALDMIEHPEFHFDLFLTGKYSHFPFMLRKEIWGFLESLYEQRDSVETGTTYPV
ncbi:MAG: hypothetical protein ACR2O8_16575 [Rhizobiaceae bacterium]